MKYTININQYAVVSLGLSLDLTDMAIFDFIKDFTNSPNCVKTTYEGEVYYWITHNLIIDALPMLGIKSRQGIIKRVDNLIASGLLTRHPLTQTLNKTFYGYGAKYNDVTFVTTCQHTLTPPVNERCHNNNIIDNNINNKENIIYDNIKESNKKTLFRNSQFAQLVKENNGVYDDTELVNYYGEAFADVDLLYYYLSVRDWSDSSNTMRTNRGWQATMSQFMRGDKDKGRLRMKHHNVEPNMLDLIHSFD